MCLLTPQVKKVSGTHGGGAHGGGGGRGMQLHHSSDLDDGLNHVKITESITEQTNLDDFMATAVLMPLFLKH